MFGLEKKKEETQPPFLFDLEKELVSDTKKAELVKRMETRIQKIKEYLKGGSSKEVYEVSGVLLNGYHALAVVLSRATKVPKQEKK